MSAFRGRGFGNPNKTYIKDPLGMDEIKLNNEKSAASKRVSNV